MITIISVVTFLFFLLLANLVWNMGWNSTTKMRTQNAADATSYSTALWMARGHNAITATNHMMGEMMAFIVVRSSLGESHDKRKDHGDIPRSDLPKWLINFLGPQDEKHQENRFNNAGSELRKAHDKAENIQPNFPPIAFKVMRNAPEVDGSNVEIGSAISDGRYYLIKILTVNYHIKFVAGVLEKVPFPPVQAVGLAIDGFTLGIDLMVMVEWIALQGMELAYRGTAPLHQAVWTAGFRLARTFQKGVENFVPPLAFTAGRNIAKENGCEGAIYPMPLAGSPPLKFHLEDDPGGVRGRSDSENESMRRSQIVRATYPWVVYHRRPLIDILNFLFLSRTSYHFVFWTNDLTLVKCRELYNEGDDFFFPVIAGSNSNNKGSESWTNNSRELEDRFAVIGFAHHKPIRYSAPSILGNPLPKGMAAYSMSLVYNANGREGNSGSEFQPNWGWDTLNWELPTQPSAAMELPANPDPHRNGHDRRETGTRPKVKLNWQAKLVPVSSRVYDAIPASMGPHKELLMRLLVVPPGLRDEMHREFHHH